MYITPWLDLVLSVAAALLWAAAALVLTDSNARANSHGMPRADWRNTVCSLSWVNALLFSILACIACCSVSQQRTGKAAKARAVVGRAP